MKTILFDFATMGAKRDRALKEVSKLFARAGTPVVDAKVSASPQKRAGISFRNVDFTMADGQRVTLAVKETGDIFQVRINDGVVPMKEQDDTALAIREIAAQLDRRRSAFQRALIRTRVALPSSARTSRSDMIKAKLERRDALVSAVAAAELELASLTP